MFRIDGLDKVQRELQRLAERAEAAEGNQSVPVEQLLTPRFMQTHTDYETASEWFAASPCKIEKAEDFKVAAWDEYVTSTTSYLSWDEMLAAASKEYLTAKLFAPE